MSWYKEVVFHQRERDANPFVLCPCEHQAEYYLPPKLTFHKKALNSGEHEDILAIQQKKSSDTRGRNLNPYIRYAKPTFGTQWQNSGLEEIISD